MAHRIDDTQPTVALVAPLLGRAPNTTRDSKFSAAADSALRCAVRLSIRVGPAADMLEDGNLQGLDEARQKPWLAVEGETLKERKPVMTQAENTYALGNLLLNYGLLSIPFVFVQSGYAALILVWAAAGVSMGTAKLLGEVLCDLQEAGCTRPDYADMAKALSGPKLAGFMAITAYAEIVAYAWGGLLILGHTLKVLAPGLELEDTILASSLLSLALSVVPDKIYSYTTAVAALSILMACGCVLGSGLQMPHWAEGPQLAGPIENVPSSLAMVMFSCGTHPILPSIFQNTSSKEEFSRVTKSGWVIYAMVASCFGAGAYFLFGGSLLPIATQNIGLDLDLEPLPAATGFAAMSAAFLVFKCQCTQVQLTRPIADSVARVVGLELRRGNGGWKSVVVTIPVVLLFGLGAYVLRHQYKELECIAGGVLMTLNSLIFPGVAYLGVCRPERLAPRLRGLAAVLVGTVIMVGTYVAPM